MAIKQQAVAYSVRVEPQRLGDLGFGISVSDRLVERDENARLESYRQRCEEIVQQIKRHVNVSSASVETETEDVCEYCGGAWTEDKGSPHNGGCCAKDEAAMETADRL